MWRRRTYSKNTAFQKRKQKGKVRRSGTSQRTPSTVQDGNNIHQPESAAELETLQNTSNIVPDATAERSGEAWQPYRTPKASLNPGLETLGPGDWNWMKANDAAIRDERRIAGHDGLPRIGITNDLHDRIISRTSPLTLVEETHTEPDVGARAKGLGEAVAKDELDPLMKEDCAGERTASKEIVQVAGRNIDAFFELFPWKEPDDETDEAQLRFEQELENEKQEIHPDSAPDVFEGIVEEEPDDWYDRTERNSNDETLGFEWDELSFEAGEFDEAPHRIDWAREVRTDGRVSRELRALQEATKLADEYAWDERGTGLLAEVFERYYWSSAKASMRRELERGMTPDELELALSLRDFWRGRSEFSIDLGYWRSDAGLGADTSRAIYHVLSWPVALRLIRMANSIPDQAEIEVFLDEFYREWYSSRILRRRYRSFRVYLYRWLEYIEERSDLIGTWSARIDTNREAEFFEDDECESAWLAHHRHELALEGLLPTGGDEPYVEMMSRAERDLLGEVLAARSELCP